MDIALQHRWIPLLLVLFVGLATVPNRAGAQETTWKQDLGQDLVEIREDKMMIEDYSLVRINLSGDQGNSLQLKVYAEAPKDGIISRDSFVSLTTLMTYELLYRLIAQSTQVSANAFMDAVEMETLAEPIGTPDLEFNLTATNAGMQIEVVNTMSGQKNRFTTTWEEVYAD